MATCIQLEITAELRKRTIAVRGRVLSWLSFGWATTWDRIALAPAITELSLKRKNRISRKRLDWTIHWTNEIKRYKKKEETKVLGGLASDEMLSKVSLLHC
jgi:hypothetical protein